MSASCPFAKYERARPRSGSRRKPDILKKSRHFAFVPIPEVVASARDRNDSPMVTRAKYVRARMYLPGPEDDCLPNGDSLQVWRTDLSRYPMRTARCASFPTRMSQNIRILHGRPTAPGSPNAVSGAVAADRSDDHRTGARLEIALVRPPALDLSQAHGGEICLLQ
jgi:hypothetical protein